ncbi:MAG: autotransporter-associated beta strand repeat-containing protein [Planctomycetes bacterium]|nr:autotransporter-associated beta strand repeat-containing protein [Planctomycetota bacterium]
MAAPSLRRRAGLTRGLIAIAVGICLAEASSAQIINSKRGFGDVGANYANLQAVGAGWYYTWGTGTAQPGSFGAKHYPMFWNSPSDATINTVKNRAGVEWVLGFNEPERTDQANMSVTTALDAWSRICNAFAGTSVKLASPAVSDNTAGRTWISDFMTQLEDRRTNAANPKYNPNLRVDAIAFHWYGYSNPNNPTEAANWFIGSVDYYRTTYGKSVMPTEFAIHDWGGAYTDQQIIDANKLFLDNVLPRLESRSYVPGYAWYHWFSDAPLYSGSPPTPTPMAHRYVGAVASGSTANIGGQNLGEYVAYLAGGTLTMTGTAPGAVKYLSALANTSSVTGGMNWGLSGTSTWVRVEPDAVLRKTGTNRLSLDGTQITNDGTIEVIGGTLRLTGSASMTGAGSMRLGAAGTLAIEQAAGTFTLDDPFAFDGGAIDAVGNLRLTGTATVSGQTTLVGTGTTTLAGPLVAGTAAAGITKAGGGILVLSTTANTYAGPTRVEGGMLAVSGRLYTGVVGTEAAITVSSGTLFASSFSDQPTGSLGNLPPAADRVILDGGALRLGGSGSTSRGFTVGPGGAILEVQPGVTVSFLESNSVGRIVSLGGDLTLQATTGSGTLAKAYVGSGGLIKTGSGIWTLAGDNAFAGDTRVVAGTLRIAGTSSLAGSTLDLNAADAGSISFVAAFPQTFSVGGLSGSRGLSIAGHTLRVGGNGRSTVSTGGIAGTGGLVKTGSGVLTLGGTSTFGGGMIIEEGILRFTGSTALPATGTVLIGSSGVFAPFDGAPVADWIAGGRIDPASTGAVAISGTLGASLDLRGLPGLSLGGSGMASFTGGVTPGAGGYRLGGGDGFLLVTADLATGAPLVKVGGDTVSLTGANSFTGGLTLAGGLLQAGSAEALGAAGTIVFSGGGLQHSAANATDYSPRFSQAAGQDFRIDTAGRSVGYSQPLVSVGGSLTKLGSGTLALAAVNDLDGTVRIAAGTLAISGTAALAAATLDLDAADAGTIVFGGTAPATFSLAGLTGVRNLALGGQSLRIGGTGRSTSYGGVISGSGGLVKEGGGMLTLAGNNAFTGTTTVAAGALRIGAGGTTGGLTGPIANQASVIFDRAGTATYANTISGTGGIVKVGDGTLTLSGTSTFSGGMRVEAGMLQVAGGVNPAARLTLAGGTFGLAKAGGSQAVAGVTITAGDSAVSNTIATGTLGLSALTRENGGVVRFVTRTGPITTSATATNGILAAWAFTGSGTGTRYATVAAGTIAAFTTGTVLSGTSAFGGIPSGDTGTVNYDVTSSGTFAAMGLTRVVNTINYGGGGGVQPAANTVTLTVNGILTTGAGPLTIGGSPRMDLVAGATRELVVNTATADVILHNGVFNNAAGASGLTKAGTATLVINGSSGYTGRTTVADGTLRFGSGGSGLVIPSSEFVIRGTLAFDHADAVTLAGGLSGDGVLRKDGGGTLSLTGSGGFSGDITVADGTLAVSGAGSLGPGGTFAGELSLAAGALFLHQGSATQTLAGAVSGAGGLAVTGGRLVLAAANTFTSDVTVGNGGAIVLAHSGALGGLPVGGGLVLGSSTASTIELATDGSGPQPSLRGSNGFGTTLVVGRPAGTTGVGLRHALASGISLSGGTVEVQASTSVTSGTAELVMPSLALTAGASGAVTRLMPTTAMVTLGGAAAAINAVPKTLELAGSSTGNMVAGAIADGVSAVSLVKSGSGTWTLAAANAFTGPTTVKEGTLRLAHSAALATTGSVAITGGRVALPADRPLAVTLKSLAIDEAAGRLDVGRGRVTIASGMTLSMLRADLTAGRDDGAWDGPGGIVSSAVAADLAAGVPRTVGWLDNGDGSFTISFAAAGDSNIDGLVDVLDAANFLAGARFDTGLDADWSQGDFTADGLVDILDAADFVSTALFDTGDYVPGPAGMAQAPLAVVPEPTSLAWLACVAAAVAGCRISRRS